jgi:predicted PurR-regulated permease PerM
MQRRRVPTGLAVLGVVLILGGLFFGFSLFVGKSLNDFLGSLPSYQIQLQQQTVELRNWLAGHGIDISVDVIRKLFNPSVAMQVVGNTLSGLTGVLANIFLIMLTVVFILLEASGLPLKIRVAKGDLDASLGPFREFLVSVNRYLAIKTVFSVLTGVTVAVWLFILNVDFPMLWGLVAFLLNYVPNIGSLIAAVPAVLLGLVQYGPGSALLVAAGFVAINTLYGSFLEPRFTGQGLGLSTLVVFISLVFWGWVLGPVGMLLSVPLTMVVKIALESRPDTRWIGILLGSAPTPPPEESSAS